MRTSIIIACLVIYGLQNSVEAQSPLPLKSNPAKTEIKLYDVSDNKIGGLFLLKDSSILVSSSLDKEDYINGNYKVADLYIDDINLITINRRGGAVENALLGAGIGMVAGALTARIINGPPPEYPTGKYHFDPWGLASYGSNNINGITYAVFVPAGAVVGAVTGAIIGGIKIKIPLNGSMKNYNLKKKKLGRYTVKYPGSPKY